MHGIWLEAGCGAGASGPGVGKRRTGDNVLFVSRAAKLLGWPQAAAQASQGEIQQQRPWDKRVSGQRGCGLYRATALQFSGAQINPGVTLEVDGHMGLLRTESKVYQAFTACETRCQSLLTYFMGFGIIVWNSHHLTC